MSYAAPVRDIRFALEDAAGVGRLQADLDGDVLTAIIETIGAFASDTLAPLNASGDRAGVTLTDGGVRAAQGFAVAYRAFVADGWQGLSADHAWGGQGLPRAVALAVHEVLHGANLSFGLAPMLTLGAIEAVSAHGSAEMRQRLLPKLVSGEWTGTMNLTEPQAGSDVGALTTRATPAADGSYRITGQKIFITWGEHDMAENIVHLVLARLPDAPPGPKGVSLFVVERILPDGAANGVRCIGVERKMGIHASPTCTMAFDNAIGWLVGEPNDGMAAMFTMMNSARINVGLQGVAVAEAAYQKALAYARERRQGRAEGATAASAIVDHPDVRRMLVRMKALVQAGRALCYAAGVEGDLAHAGNAAAKAREGLLTPLVKAWCTDMGVEVSSLGVQVHGGMGFVEEGGAAQFYRDARILPIYEGTNGIQAMDLVGRKVLGDRGAAMQALITDAREVAHALRERQFDAIGRRLAEAAQVLSEATAHVLAAPRRDALAGADAYLRLAAETAAAMLTGRGLVASPDGSQARLCAVFAETVLAAAPARLAAIRVGADALFEIDL